MRTQWSQSKAAHHLDQILMQAAVVLPGWRLSKVDGLVDHRCELERLVGWVTFTSVSLFLQSVWLFYSDVNNHQPTNVWRWQNSGWNSNWSHWFETKNKNHRVLGILMYRWMTVDVLRPVHKQMANILHNTGTIRRGYAFHQGRRNREDNDQLLVCFSLAESLWYINFKKDSLGQNFNNRDCPMDKIPLVH